jgi:hypothetical protein
MVPSTSGRNDLGGGRTSEGSCENFINVGECVGRSIFQSAFYGRRTRRDAFCRNPKDGGRVISSNKMNIPMNFKPESVPNAPCRFKSLQILTVYRNRMIRTRPTEDFGGLDVAQRS